MTTKYYDIFNGDADGICALHQLRLAEPREATLVTGVKRDIRLLEQVAQVRGGRAHRAGYLPGQQPDRIVATA